VQQEAGSRQPMANEACMPQEIQTDRSALDAMKSQSSKGACP
jgi:hypothetical protein